MGTITRDTLNRLMDLRDEARDGYHTANFGALAQLHIGIDIKQAGWAIIPDTEDGIANFLLGREITAAAIIQRIAPSLGLLVSEEETPEQKDAE
jgi:hypothetical protein